MIFSQEIDICGIFISGPLSICLTVIYNKKVRKEERKKKLDVDVGQVQLAYSPLSLKGYVDFIIIAAKCKIDYDILLYNCSRS